MDRNQDIQVDRSRYVIHRHRDFLVDRMSPDFGLVDKLYSNNRLTNSQREQIEAESVSEKRNEILLKHIVEENAGKKLFEALEECGQSHLVKYMEAKGVYKPEFGGNWPLSEKERKILKENYETLVDLLDSRDLVSLLYQTGVVNKRQRNLITSKATAEGQNKVLLEIMRIGSLDGYWQTIRCLHASNQSHIAKIFESGGVVVRIDANLQTESSNLTEIENSLVVEVTNLLSNTSLSDADRIWEKVKLNLVAVAAKHSISLYFLCPNQDEMGRLEQMASDGQLKEFVEDLFNRLIMFPKRIKVTLKWSKKLSSESKKYIEGYNRKFYSAIEVKQVNYEPMKTPIQCLPLKLLDTILQSVYLRLILRIGAWNGAKDSDIIVLLASVDSCWIQRILRKGFKKPIWLQLEKIYRREFEMYFSFLDCQSYLEEAIQVVEAVGLRRNKLLTADGLRDFQIERILRKKLSKDNRRGQSDMMSFLSKEIFPMRRGFERGNIHEDFISFLRRTNQTNEARVFAQGGTSAKVVIKRPKNSKTDGWSREFSSRLNNLKDKNQVKSDDVETIIEKQEYWGLEILDSFVDRDVFVWIWCKEQNAVETLKMLYESDTLIDYLYRLGDENDRNRNNKDIHLEEISQLKTAFVRDQGINLVEKLQTDKDFYWLAGVTKLRNQIFVLGYSLPSKRDVLYVFDDQHPFRLKRKMTFKEIDRATNIFSFEKDFCLYITDFGAKCIWKIRFPDEDKIEDGEFTKFTVLKYLDFPSNNCYPMTVTNEGHIVTLDRAVPVLLIYESESALNRPIRIDLPDDIYQPEQVAANSAGNFILLHRKPGVIHPGVVSEVDRNGKTIIRQHLETRDGWIFADVSADLHVDSNDRIILSNFSRRSFVFLDSRLRYLRSFRPTLYCEGEDGKPHPFYPYKLFCDGGINQLIVAGMDEVFVHSFSGI